MMILLSRSFEDRKIGHVVTGIMTVEPLFEQFFRSSRPGYLHPVCSELENSGIRVAVGDCSVTERRRWRPPYQTGMQTHYKHDEDRHTAQGVRGLGSVLFSHSENVVRRIGLHTT